MGEIGEGCLLLAEVELRQATGPGSKEGKKANSAMSWNSFHFLLSDFGRRSLQCIIHSQLVSQFWSESMEIFGQSKEKSKVHYIYKYVNCLSRISMPALFSFSCLPPAPALKSKK